MQPLTGITVNAAQAAAFKDAFITAVATITGVAKDQISITSINAARRRLLAGITIDYTVTTASNAAVNVLIQNSNLPIATILSSNGYPGLSISAVSTTVTAAAPTSSTSFAGDQNSKLSFGGIIGVVVGVVLGSILTAGGHQII